MKDLKQFNNGVEYFCINIKYHIRKKKKRKAKPTNIQQQILKKDVTSSA